MLTVVVDAFGKLFLQRLRDHLHSVVEQGRGGCGEIVIGDGAAQ